jgi:uncharacterized membrane protein
MSFSDLPVLRVGLTGVILEFGYMRRTYTPVLAAGIGVVAGLRSLTAPAVVSWAAREKMIRPLHSLPARMLLARSSKKIAQFAVGELIADKLPGTPNRISPLPLTFRVISGAACGAAVSSAADESPKEGAAYGALGAFAGAFAGFYLRKRLSRDFPGFAVAIVEDVLAISAAAGVVCMLSNRQS